jgi:UDP-N-acetylglucosamine--N-acetylmuramyl-(pentapeptide) pyrophosphoryl-undecaprenol N-acetylglucosamine transferase
LASQVLEAFPGSFGSIGHLPSNPVRAEIAAVAAPPLRFAERERRSRLLVFGGSQGAQRLNSVVPQALARVALEQRPQVRHQTGERGLETARAAYAAAQVEAEVLPFINDMAAAYAADLRCRGYRAAGRRSRRHLRTVGRGDR